MGRVATAVRHLRNLEATLRAAPRGTLDPAEVADRVAEVLALLGTEEARWIGTTEAKRLLGLGSENTVKAWARLGLLRACTLPNGRTRVLLDDVLRRRAEDEALLAVGGDDLAPDEVRQVEEVRPGSLPWQRRS